MKVRAKMRGSVEDISMEAAVTYQENGREKKGHYFKDIFIAWVPFLVLENTKGLSSLEITFWWLSSVSMTMAALWSRVGVMVSLVLSQYRGWQKQGRGVLRTTLTGRARRKPVTRTDHVPRVRTLFKQGSVNHSWPAWGFSPSGRHRCRNEGLLRCSEGMGGDLYSRALRPAGAPLSLTVKGLRLSNKASWGEKQLIQERRQQKKDVLERDGCIGKDGQARNSLACTGHCKGVRGTRSKGVRWGVGAGVAEEETGAGSDPLDLIRPLCHWLGGKGFSARVLFVVCF